MAKLKTLAERTRDNDWPAPATFKNPEECEAAYNNGYEGCFPDPDGAEMMESQEDGIFADAAYKYGIAGSGANKLSLAYAAVWKVAGRDDFFHGSKSQPTGDCVGRGCSHSLTGSLACAVFNGKGSWPEIPDEQYKTGMPISPVGTYWCKKGGVSGWSCSTSMSRAKDTIGLVVGVPYDNPNVNDLMTAAKYSTNTLSKYCKKGPPDDVIQSLNAHKMESYSKVKSFDELCDALQNGYFANSCGSQGFAKSRDEWGRAKRSGSWSHSMCVVATDSTEAARSKYNTAGMVCFLNSWGTSWIKGPREVQGKSDLPPIPKGAFWCKWEEVSSRDYNVCGVIKGFPPQKLPEWNLRSLL